MTYDKDAMYINVADPQFTRKRDMGGEVEAAPAHEDSGSDTDSDATSRPSSESEDEADDVGDAAATEGVAMVRRLQRLKHDLSHR